MLRYIIIRREVTTKIGQFCIVYYIPSIHNYTSVQWYYIYTRITLWQHVSTVRRSSSGQYGTFLRYSKVSTQWDPISFTVKAKIIYDEIGLKMTVYGRNMFAVM